MQVAPNSVGLTKTAWKLGRPGLLGTIGAGNSGLVRAGHRGPKLPGRVRYRQGVPSNGSIPIESPRRSASRSFTSSHHSGWPLP